MYAVEEMAADSILKRGVRFPIPAPFFLRLLGKKKTHVTITQMFLGTELRVAKLALQLTREPDQMDEVEKYKYLLENHKTILKIVALSTLNMKHPFVLMWFRKRKLKRLKIWQLFELYTKLKQYSGVTHFTHITRLAVMTRMTKPNLGQEADGG